MSDPKKAVFLSYASQDAAAARRLCDALRAAGAEVWFDGNQARGDDAWDQAIRQQIWECAIFMPLMSASTADRPDGYMRLEWSLADQRARMLARHWAFILPVYVNTTREAHGNLPDSFLKVQWTRLSEQEPPAALARRVCQLLAETPTAMWEPGTAPAQPLAVAASRQSQPTLWVAVGLLVFAAGVFVLERDWQPMRSGGASVAAESATAPGRPGIVENSIAVLPFAAIGEAQDPEYVADGLSEELLDRLAKIPDLRVPARTSSFYFKGKVENVAIIAEELGVRHLLEGSIRRSGTSLRVTAELIRADTGYSLWSATYDRDVKDVVDVEEEIASAVVATLKLKLGAGAGGRVAYRTASTEAYSRYLKGLDLFRHANLDDLQRAIAAFQEALALDPGYAAADAKLALTIALLADQTGDLSNIARATAYAEKAVALAPDLAGGYAARGYIRANWGEDWSGARLDLEKALAEDAADSAAQVDYAGLMGRVGRVPEALAASQKAVELDPLSAVTWQNLGKFLLASRQFAAADRALHRALELQPSNAFTWSELGALALLDGKFTDALAAYQQVDLDGYGQAGVAMAQYSLGHVPEAQQSLDAAIATASVHSVYQIGAAYAWRGSSDQAFLWLERAYVQHAGGLADMKFDLLLGTLHDDPRFQALMRKMKLPP